MNLNNNPQLEQVWNNRADAIKHFSKVHSDIKKDIEDDFILGKPTEQEKKFIIRMAGLSNFARNIYQKIYESAIKMSENTNISKEHRNSLLKQAKIIKEEIIGQVYYNHMLKSKMLVIMSRNNEDNFLLKVAGDVKVNKENEIVESNEESNSVKKLLERIKPNKEEE